MIQITGQRAISGEPLKSSKPNERQQLLHHNSKQSSTDLTLPMRLFISRLLLHWSARFATYAVKIAPEIVPVRKRGN